MPQIEIPQALRNLRRLITPQTAGALIPLSCGLVAVLWANSPWSDSYFAMWDRIVTIQAGAIWIAKSWRSLVNDDLLVLFFLFIGLRVKRRILLAELAADNDSILPSTVVEAFATGLAILIGMAGVTVIAVRGSTEVSVDSLVLGAGLVALLALSSAAGIGRSAIYGVLGIALWIVALGAGIHPTVVGVIVAMMVPGWTRLDATEFIDRAEVAIATFQSASRPFGVSMSNPHQQESLEALHAATVKVESPLIKIETFLHPVVIFVVVPLFALANAGVAFRSGAADWLAWPVVASVAFGIILAKPVALVVASRLAIANGLAAATSRTTARQLYGLGGRDGVGFIIALFLTSVAFAGNPLLDSVRTGVLIGSLVLGVVGCLVMVRIKSPDRPEPTVIAFPTVAGSRERSHV